MIEVYCSGDEFHTHDKQIYRASLDWAINKKHASMAKVVYEPAHENLQETGIKRGRGKDWATWVFSEEPDTREGLFSTPLELVIDARLEPGGAIGLHSHIHTEEFYYLLEGLLTMTTVNVTGEEQRFELHPGDAHLVRLGQSHYGVAGPEGARFLTVAIRSVESKT